ncbi:MAG: hypothetical protein GF331_21945, partial [Chitinivibrionales bacterium]|nr:hypothetical protein [Chitinivibrionales bacterium]
RTSDGTTFDLVYHDIFMETDPQLPDGIIQAGAGTALDIPYNSPGNEYGPYLAVTGMSLWARSRLLDWSEAYEPRMLFFASDRQAGCGGLNLWVSAGRVDVLSGPDSTVPEPVVALDALNGDADDAYITFGPRNSVLFCSDRDGDFDIYALVPDVNLTTGNVATVLADTSLRAQATKVAILNSPADDKCPFVHDYTLFFVSDRQGGQGGFDIYRSAYSGGVWGEPRNLGPVVNSAANEYRPYCSYNEEYGNRVLFFSSDRDGGIGGYDIYYVGVE